MENNEGTNLNQDRRMDKLENSVHLLELVAANRQSKATERIKELASSGIPIDTNTLIELMQD